MGACVRLCAGVCALVCGRVCACVCVVVFARACRIIAISQARHDVPTWHSPLLFVPRRFSTHPLLCVSVALCAAMEADEALVLAGAEQFSLSSGYAFDLRFAGNAVDGSPRDATGTVRVEVH